MRPKTLIIHDNLKKKIYFIINCFSDEKINDYEKKFEEISSEIEKLIFLSSYETDFFIQNNKKKIKIKSNISKKNFLKM